MPSNGEKARRKEIAKKQRLEAAQAERARLPLDPKVMELLFNYIDDCLIHGCDHTLQHTIQFLSNHTLPEEPIIRWLQEHGGYCDCEVINNAEDKFGEMMQQLSQGHWIRSNKE